MNFVLAFLIAFGLSLILTPQIAVLAKKFNLVDDPKKRKHPATLHKKVIPREAEQQFF